jgi:hypothetical protein
VTGRPPLGRLVPVPTRSRPRPAPGLSGVGLTGRPCTVALRGPHRTLLLFLGPRCDACVPFWPAAADPPGLGLEPDERVVTVVRAAEAGAIGPLVTGPASGVAPVVVGADVWGSFGVLGPPYFVLVAETGDIVSEGVAWSPGQVGADVRRSGGPTPERRAGGTGGA